MDQGELSASLTSSLAPADARRLVQTPRSVSWRREFGAAGAVAVVGFLTATYGQHVLQPWLARLGEDVYFQADPVRVLTQMTTRWHDGGYTRNHPLLPILLNPPVKVFQLLTGSTPITAALLEMRMAAILWCAAAYGTLRLAGVRLLDAGLVVLASLVSSGFLFWFAVPETFPFSTLGILGPFAAAAAIRRVERRESILIGAGLLSISLTITNWMAGLAAAFAGLPWRRALQVSANVLAIATLAWGIERRVYPHLEFFLDKPPDSQFVYAPTGSRATRVLQGIFINSVVMPAVELCDNPPVSWARNAPRHYLSVQHAVIGSGGPAAWVATACWLILIALGFLGLALVALPLRVVVLVTLVGQIGLHLVFGGETFLYAAHFVTILFFVGGLATVTRFRRIALGLLLVFAVGAALTNTTQLNRTAAYFGTQPNVIVSRGHVCQY